MSVGICQVGVRVAVNGESPECGVSGIIEPVEPPESGFSGDSFRDAGGEDPDGVVTLTNFDRNISVELNDAGSFDFPLSLRGSVAIPSTGRRIIQFNASASPAFPSSFPPDQFRIGVATLGATLGGLVTVPEDAGQADAFVYHEPTIFGASAGGSNLSGLNQIAQGQPIFTVGGGTALTDLIGAFTFNGVLCFVRSTSDFHELRIHDETSLDYISNSTLGNFFGGTVDEPFVGALTGLFHDRFDNTLYGVAATVLWALDLDDPYTTGWVNMGAPFPGMSGNMLSVARDPISRNWFVGTDDTENLPLYIFDSSFVLVQEILAGFDIGGPIQFINFYNSVATDDVVIIGAIGDGYYAVPLRGPMIATGDTTESTNFGSATTTPGAQPPVFFDAPNRACYTRQGTSLTVTAMEDTNFTSASVAKNFVMWLDFDGSICTVRDDTGAWGRASINFGGDDVYAFLWMGGPSSPYPTFECELISERKDITLQVRKGHDSFVAFEPLIAIATLNRLSNSLNNALGISAAGEVFGWGPNDAGQNDVPGGLEIIKQVASGSNSPNAFSLALDVNGEITAWGNDADDQVTNAPVGIGFQYISAGGAHALAIDSFGGVVAWGDNAQGQTNVPVIPNPVVQVAAGGLHSLALDNQGILYAWGHNASGQTNIPSFLQRPVFIAAGFENSWAITMSGEAVGWGQVPPRGNYVPAWLSNIVQVNANSRYAVAIKDTDDDYFIFGPQVNLVDPNVEPISEIAIGGSDGGGGETTFANVIRSLGCFVGWGYNVNNEASPPYRIACSVGADAPGVIYTNIGPMEIGEAFNFDVEVTTFLADALVQVSNPTAVDMDVTVAFAGQPAVPLTVGALTDNSVNFLAVAAGPTILTITAVEAGTLTLLEIFED